MADAQPSLGGKVGGRVAELVSAATVATRAKMAPHTVGVAMQIQDAFFRLVGAEIRDTIGEPLGRIADAPNAPAWVKRTFGFLARGHGQWQGFLAQNVGGQALGVGLGQLLTNELTPTISEIVASNPNALVDPATMAQLVARGQLPVSTGRTEAARQGVNGNRFGWLIGAAQHGADPSSLLDAYRRKRISEPELNAGLKDAGYTPEAVAILKELWTVPLSPAALADMVQRGIITESAASEIASYSGATADDFTKMVQASGQALALQDLLFLYRRGKITRARLEQGIRQGNTRNEWIPEAEQLGTVPMSTADAISAAVQNHLSQAEAKRIAQENGLEPDHFQPLYDTAGEPLSRTEMTELWNRGEVTQSQVEQALREGRLKNKYIADVLKLRRYILPPDTVRLMYERGVLDQKQAIAYLLMRGLTAQDAGYYVQMARSAKMQTSRDLTESTIRTLYADQAITHDEAVTNLKNIGYDDNEAAQILSISDLQRNERLLNSAVSRVHARFVAHRIDDVGATTAMDALHVPPDQRDAYIATWQVERDLNTPTLSVSQVQQAMRKQLLTARQAYDRLANMGYDDTDARILVALGGGTLS